MGLLMTQMFPGTLMMIPLYQIIEFLGSVGPVVGPDSCLFDNGDPFLRLMMKGYF